MSQNTRILIIDDQYGRCGLGPTFAGSVQSDTFAAYKADRRNLCLSYGILDLSGDSDPIPPKDAQCGAMFCPGQKWDAESKRIENDLDCVVEAVASGWSFRDGSRWALILLDLAFVEGPLDTFGDPQERTFFGRDVILPALRERFGEDIPLVVLSSTPREEQNEAVRRAGALDFIQRIPNRSLPPGTSRANLAEMLFTHGLFPDESGLVAGHSLATLKLLRQARRGALSARNILLLGETGTGKNLLAKYIHHVSDRRSKPFEEFHAGSQPGELQADALFGHVKGAFTGAVGECDGVWQRANSGTLFIDEVGDLETGVQQRLMRPIEERKVHRLGEQKEIEIDARVILATNRDLDAAAAEGSFKMDFLNRINAFKIVVTSLRERREDIPALVRHLVTVVAPQWKGNIQPDAMEELTRRDWRNGNVRELRNVLDRAITNNPLQDITVGDLDDEREEEIPQPKAVQRSVPHTEPTASEPLTKRKVPGLSLAMLIETDVDRFPLGEIERLKREAAGTFPQLLAQALVFALQLTQNGGKLNPTAAVRFLLGNETLSTVQAKQFIKRLLILDTVEHSVQKAFEATGHAERHAMLRRLVQEVSEPRRMKKPARGKAND